jgi:hypothetical protein
MSAYLSSEARETGNDRERYTPGARFDKVMDLCKGDPSLHIEQAILKVSRFLSKEP